MRSPPQKDPTLLNQQSSLLGPGTAVQTTQLNQSMIREWTEATLASKKWNIRGRIVAQHDSHGLCYDVEHSDGIIGCYDPSEFVTLS